MKIISDRYISKMLERTDYWFASVRRGTSIGYAIDIQYKRETLC